MMAANDGSYGYEMEIIVPADSAIQSPADIEGKALAFTAPTSNSGFKAPSALLLSEFGLAADKDYKTAFSGKHDNSRSEEHTSELQSLMRLSYAVLCLHKTTTSNNDSIND